jgi:hypothetical protein
MTYNRRLSIAEKLIEAGLATEKDAMKMITVLSKHPKIAKKFFKKFGIIDSEADLNVDEVFDIIESHIDIIIRSK